MSSRTPLHNGLRLAIRPARGLGGLTRRKVLLRCSGLRTLGFSAPVALVSRAVLSRASHVLYSNANSITEIAARELAQTPLSCASILITPKNGLQAHVQFAPHSEHWVLEFVVPSFSVPPFPKACPSRQAPLGPLTTCLLYTSPSPRD